MKYLSQTIALVLLIVTAPSARAAVVPFGELPDSEAFASSFNSVGIIKAFAGGGAWVGGSVEAIDDGGDPSVTNWAISVQHGIRNTEAAHGPVTAIQVTFESQAFTAPASSFYDIDAWYEHAGYVDNGSGYSNQNDIMLLHSATPFAVTPLNLDFSGFTLGDSVTMVGYGTPGYDSTGFFPYDGIRRGGLNTISGFGSDGQISFLTYDPNFAFTDFDGVTHLNYYASNGDSGGMVSKASGSIQGLMTFVAGSAGSMEPGYFTFNSTGILQFGPYEEWIHETIGVPEPSTYMLLLAACPAFLLLVRRKRQFKGRNRTHCAWRVDLSE